MRRPFAALIAGVVVASVMTLFQGPVSESPVRLAQQAESAVQNFGGCLRGQHAGDLLLLIDESWSLRSSPDGGPGTDVEGKRVDAAKLLLKQMSRLADRGKVELNVQLAGFASEFAEPTAWSVLNQSTLDDLLSEAESFRARNNGFDTDYWMALDGARQALAGHRAPGGEGPRCQAIVWFSDGALNIEPRIGGQDRIDHGTTRPYAEGLELTTPEAAKEATRLAAESLCREGSKADELRSRGVFTFAIGLSNPPGKQDFSLMRSIATGQSYLGQPCGKIVSPPPGDFHEASDIDELLAAFDKTIPPPPIDRQAGICPSDLKGCPDADKHTFVLDESIDGVHILARAVDRPGLQLRLTGPDGRVHPLPQNGYQRDAQVDLGGIGLTYSWQTPESATVDLSNPNATAAGWTGQWALAFIDPTSQNPSGTSRSNIHIEANVVPDWVNKPGNSVLTAGTTAPDIQLALTKTDKTTIDPTQLRGKVSVSAILVDQNGNQTTLASDLDKAAISDPIRLDLSKVQPGTATLRLLLKLTTADVVQPGRPTIPGTELAPQQVDIPFKISPRASELPSEIDFGPHEFGGPGDDAWEIDTTVPFPGPACVWVDPAAGITTDAVPDRVSGVSVKADGATSSQTCARAKADERGQLKLRLSGRGAAQGAVNGTVPVTVAPLDSPTDAQTVNIPFTADLKLPINPWKFGMVFVLVFLAGIGIPTGLLYLFQWLSQRIPNDPPIYAKRIPVSIQGSDVLRTDEGGAFAVRREDLRHFAERLGRGGLRSSAAEVELRPRVSWNPFDAGYVSVVDTSGRTTAANSSTDQRSYGKARRARLPLVVRDTWVLIHDLSGPEDQAEVVVLFAASATEQDCDALTRSVISHARDRLTELRNLAGTSGGYDQGRHGQYGESPYPASPSMHQQDQPVTAPYEYGPPGQGGAPYEYGPPGQGGAPYEYGPPGQSGAPSTGGGLYGPPRNYDHASDYGPPGGDGGAARPGDIPQYGPPADDGRGAGSGAPYGPPPATPGSPWPT